MSKKSNLENFELLIVCILGSICFGYILIIIILIHRMRKKRIPGTEREALIKKIESQKNKKHVFKNGDDSRISYSAMFRKEIGKLALKIKDISIGENTMCVKPYLTQLYQLFFRISLNNNATNSIIISKKYDFNSKVIVEEMFFFSLMEYQLKGTSVVVEAFFTLFEGDHDLSLGWVEFFLPNELKDYPLIDNPVLSEVFQPLDLYLKTLGCLCISLEGSNDKVRLGILASYFDNSEWIDENRKDISVFFTLLLKNEEEESINHICKTNMKVPSTNLSWNEIFYFDVPKELRRSSYIVVELWIIQVTLSLKSEELAGIIHLGLTEKCPIKSKMHWNYIVDKESEENTRWHFIHSV